MMKPMRTTLLVSLPVGAVQQFAQWAERSGQSASEYCAQVLGNYLADRRGERRRMEAAHETARGAEERA